MVKFDPMANLSRTYEENIHMVYICITKGYYFEIRGEKKTHGDINCTFGWQVGVVAVCKYKDRGRGN